MRERRHDRKPLVDRGEVRRPMRPVAGRPGAITITADERRRRCNAAANVEVRGDMTMRMQKPTCRMTVCGLSPRPALPPA